MKITFQVETLRLSSNHSNQESDYKNKTSEVKNYNPDISTLKFEGSGVENWSKNTIRDFIVSI